MRPEADFLNLDSLLTDEERMIRNTVRQFVDEQVKPIIADCYETARFPKELMPEFAKLGLFGVTLPEKYGCANASNVSYGLICQELEAGDSGLRSFVSVQSSLCMYPIYAFGSEAQKQKYLPAMAKGEVIACFGLTESNSGSDPGSMRTRAKRHNGGWLINGSKAWITNGAIADIAIVWAKVEDENDKIRGFIVPTDTPGFSAPEIKHKLSLRASITSELFFQDVFLPEDALLPETGGLKSPLSCLTQARFGIAWGVLGAAIDCFQTALDYSKNRIQFNRPLASFQLTQQKLAEMFTEITKGQLLVWRMSQLKDQSQLTPTHVSMAKMNNVRLALECARTARSILGGNGIMGEYGVMRHMSNLETVFTYEGTHEVHLLSIGRHLTGLSAFE
ncbi:MAG: acyl-CoA dehydrogenase [Acidobacteria bacterium]|nr:acyl-CoA dehydrogenase [Acidobacteriota bacterium]